MTGPATCELIGRWRIIEADLWDRDYLDLVEPAHLQIGNEGWAEFALGCCQRHCRTQIWSRHRLLPLERVRQGRRNLGDGATELQDDGSIKIELSFDNGDDAVLTARRQ